MQTVIVGCMHEICCPENFALFDRFFLFLEKRYAYFRKKKKSCKKRKSRKGCALKNFADAKCFLADFA